MELFLFFVSVAITVFWQVKRHKRKKHKDATLQMNLKEKDNADHKT